MLYSVLLYLWVLTLMQPSLFIYFSFETFSTIHSFCTIWAQCLPNLCSTFAQCSSHYWKIFAQYRAFSGSDYRSNAPISEQMRNLLRFGKNRSTIKNSQYYTNISGIYVQIFLFYYSYLAHLLRSGSDFLTLSHLLRFPYRLTKGPEPSHSSTET